MKEGRGASEQATVHGGVFLAILLLARVGLPALAWPWFWVIPLTAYAAIVLGVPWLRRTFPRPRGGTINRLSVAVTAAASVLSCGVLVGYQVLFRPEVDSLARGLPVAAFGSLVLEGTPVRPEPATSGGPGVEAVARARAEHRL